MYSQYDNLESLLCAVFFRGYNQRYAILRAMTKPDLKKMPEHHVTISNEKSELRVMLDNSARGVELRLWNDFESSTTDSYKYRWHVRGFKCSSRSDHAGVTDTPCDPFTCLFDNPIQEHKHSLVLFVVKQEAIYCNSIEESHLKEKEIAFDSSYALHEYAKQIQVFMVRAFFLIF